jgi:DnaD/phage-associated family protein
MPTERRPILKADNQRTNYSVIYDELWDVYLEFIGPEAALLYCYLSRLLRFGVPDPTGSEWRQAVCAPLGLSLEQSHAAWARLLESELVTVEPDGTYLLHVPRARGDVLPWDTSTARLTVAATMEREATLRAARGTGTMLSFCEQQFGRALSPVEFQRLEEIQRRYPRDLAEEAVAEAVLAQKLVVTYVEQVLANWAAQGVKTVEQAREVRQKFREAKAAKRTRQKKTTTMKNPEGAVEVDYDEIARHQAAEWAKKHRGGGAVDGTR